MNNSNLGKYRKTIVAAVGSAVAILTYLYADANWLPALVNLLTVLGVYQTKNDRI